MASNENETTTTKKERDEKSEDEAPLHRMRALVAEKNDCEVLDDVMKKVPGYPDDSAAYVLDHGIVRLMDVMPRLVPRGKTADYVIAETARVSYGKGTRKTSDDTTLIRRLYRDKHTSPFEMMEFRFYLKMPLFVARQLVRHRTASLNEYSGRYSEIKECYYLPGMNDVRKQSGSNKQGSEEEPFHSASPLAADFRGFGDRSAGECHKKYTDFLKRGMAREQARIILPQSQYTEMYWKIDLHNLFNFIHLRMVPEAQSEIRVYARAMFDAVRHVAPVACQAFLDYRYNAVTLTALEIDALKNGGEIQTNNATEKKEWETKRKLLGPPLEPKPTEVQKPDEKKNDEDTSSGSNPHPTGD